MVALTPAAATMLLMPLPQPTLPSLALPSLALPSLAQLGQLPRPIAPTELLEVLYQPAAVVVQPPPMLTAVRRLVVNDANRCLASLHTVDECRGVTARLETAQQRASRWMDSRTPIIQWAARRWIDWCVSEGLGLECRIGERSLTLSSALAPIQPWRLCREVGAVAPLRVLAITWECLLLWLLRTVLKQPPGPRRLHKVLDGITSAHEVAWARGRLVV